MRKVLGAGVLALALFGLALADEVKKKDGTVLEGDVIEDTEDHVTIRNKLGDIRISRKDVALVKKVPQKGLEGDLEKLKKATIEKLELLVRDAEKVGRADAMRALRAHEDEVRAWTLPAADDGKKPAEFLDFVETAQRFMKITHDASLTDFQKKTATEALAKEISEKPTGGKMKIVDVTPRDDCVAVTGVVGPYKPTWFFTDENDKKRLATAQKGDEISVEGAIYHEGKVNFLPGIRNARLK